MKKLLTVVAGIFLSGLLVASAIAAPNSDSGTPQKKQQTRQSSTNKKSQKYVQALSKRNQAKLEQAKEAQMKHDTIMQEKAAAGNK